LLGAPRYNSYGSKKSPTVVNGYGVSPVHTYHGSGFNLGKWFKKAGHTVGNWTKKAVKTVGAFARKEGPAVLHVLENAGRGAGRALGAAIPAALTGNYAGAAAALAGGAAQGVLQGGGFRSVARAPKRLKRY